MMKITVKETAIFGMLSALMYLSKVLMEIVPNVHLLGAFIVAITVVYRLKALYPIYGFVLLTGLLNGFAMWWIPYLYIWACLWGAVMLLPKKLPKKAEPFIYMGISALHGLLYGVLYAPSQAIMFGLDFKGTVAWIIAGLPWDLAHGVGNLVAGLLIMPIVTVLRKTQKGM